MKKYTIPDYYIDESLTEEEKKQKDLEMVARDFPLVIFDKEALLK